MAVKTIAELKTLWINGFIPDEDDYADLFDTLEARGTSGSFTPIALDTSTPLTVNDSKGYFMKIGGIFSFTMSIDLGVQTGSGLFRIGGMPYEYPASGVLGHDLAVTGILEGTNLTNLSSLVWKLEDYGNIIPNHDSNSDGTYSSLTPSDVSSGTILITGVAYVGASAAINTSANVTLD